MKMEEGGCWDRLGLTRKWSKLEGDLITTSLVKN